MALGITQTGSQQQSTSGWENQTMQQAQQQAQNQAQSGAQNQQNTYNAGQLALQGQLPQQYLQALQGQVPQGFTAPQSVIDAWNTNFQNYIAPGIAATKGAGSPAIASQQSMGLQQLLANMYQQGQSNYSNILGQSSQYAMNPTGQNVQNSQQSSGNTTGLTNQQTAGTSGQSTTSNWQVQQPWEIIQNMLGGAASGFQNP